MPVADWLRRNPRHAPKVWMLLGFMPFGLGILPGGIRLYMAIISWEWSGHVKGMEFSLLDALALAIYFGLPRTRHSLPFLFSMALYFLATVLSAIDAAVPMAALFYSWQLARMFLVYAVVAKGSSEDPRVIPAILKGMAVALIAEAGIAIWERFHLEMLQATGTVGHQNLLGLMSHFTVFPLFALLLAGKRGWLPVAGVLAGLVIEVLTTSRATVGLAGGGYAAVFMLSALRQWTSRKALILAVGLAAVSVAVPLALASFETRFATDEAPDDYDERAAFTRAAEMIISDHPLFGAGANNYVVVANTGNYNARAGVALRAESLGTNVHNIYLLIAAETGYFGLAAFVLLLAQTLAVAFFCGLRHRADIGSDLMIGFGAAMLVIYVHSAFEWIFITFNAQYSFAIELGMVAGLAQQLGYWRRRPQPQPRQAALSGPGGEAWGLTQRTLK
jgi:hypothetical protein